MHESYEGTIQTIRSDKGFGFISCKNFAADLFFHCSVLDESLVFDQRLRELRVRFKVIETGKGQRAVDVRPAD
jgi:cold shock CspA family protein